MILPIGVTFIATAGTAILWAGRRSAALETGALLPGPDATLAGPTFEEWLDSTSDVPQ